MPADVAPEPEDGHDFDLDAEFSAIVSGISSQMHWATTADEWDAAAQHTVGPSGTPPRSSPADPWAPDPAAPGGPVVPRAPSGGYPGAGIPPATGSGFSESGFGTRFSEFDTADDRRRRRELRRLEREAELEAFQEEQAAIQAEREADTAHFEPPTPPPLPRPRGRTIGAVLIILAGIVVLAWPRLLALSGDATLILGLLLILGGLILLFAGLRRRRGEPGDGWDDGAVV